LFKGSRQDAAVPDAADLERLLRAAGLRVTRPRVAVLDAVHARPHLDTEALIGATRARLGAVSHQAV
jgi:Fe2+ or Zn2+ uptake regulation protein